MDELQSILKYCSFPVHERNGRLVIHAGDRVIVTLTRSQFEDMIEDILEKAMSLVKRVLEDGRIGSNEVDDVGVSLPP